MPAALEARVLEMRRAHPFWGPRRILAELSRARVSPLPSESAVYRCLVRAGVIEPVRRRRRAEAFKRWERAAPMELWQMDVVGGFHLADGSSAKALTGIDDHSRFCVSARLMLRERTQAVCDGLAAAMQSSRPVAIIAGELWPWFYRIILRHMIRFDEAHQGYANCLGTAETI